MAPIVAATSRNQGAILALVARALMAATSVEPGTTVPTIGMASERARKKIAQHAYCGCAAINSVSVS